MLQHTLATHRAFGVVKRRRPMPHQLYPKLIEAEYAKTVVNVMDRARPLLEPLRRELPHLLAAAHAARGDRRDVGESSRARTMIDHARAQLEAALRPTELEHLAETYARRTAIHQKAQLARQIWSALGIDVAMTDRRLPTLIEHFVTQNVSLIRSVPVSVVGHVEKLVTAAFSSGTQHEDLAADIEGRFDIGERHARLIARDQIGKLNGQVNAFRQQDLGIKSFVWNTMHDERVRPEHEELDGKTFSYDDPPDEGLPGEPILCRCYGDPVLDEIDA